ETGRQLVLDASRVCKKPRRLRGKQSVICKSEPDIVREITRGAQMATRECQHQFRYRRWNCTSSRRSLRKVLLRDTRETSFVDAITAAGVTFAISQACSLGTLLDCSCHRISRASNSLSGDYDWRGCSDNIDFGYRKSKEFMDDKIRKRSDVKTFLLSHNYEAGRLTVRNYMRTVCKCHGMSGSCTLKTCWRKLPLFRDVGHKLKEKFDGASKVMAGNDGRGFIPEGDTIKVPGKEDLVYSEESPAFCEPNRKTGSLGTQGRECNHTSMGVDGCELLCCGRGSEPIHKVEYVNCRCRFQWCCEVICDTCVQKRTVHRCL
ncbi:Wnt6-like protein, partial [Leptotrombidium deliense]